MSDNEEWLTLPQDALEIENARRARRTLAEIYNTNNESAQLSAVLVLGARKPLEVIRA